MFNQIKSQIKNFDWLMLASVLLLICFGLIEIYSVSLGRENADFLNFQKQIYFAVAGIVLLFVFSFIDSYFIRSLSRYLYALGSPNGFAEN